jgi:hypothetical protein
MESKMSNSLLALMYLFGPPPVLSSENIDHYNEMCGRMTACLDPEDFLELAEVRIVVDSTWEAQRYSRHRTLSVERRLRQSLEFQQERARAIKKRREQEIRNLAEKLGRPPSDFARWVEIETEFESVLIETEEVFDRIPTELQQARALEAAIEYHEQLELLINGALHRRENALVLLDIYRSGLGQRLRRESDQIIEAAATVAEEPAPQIEAAPSVLSPDVSADVPSDVPSEASSDSEVTS